MWQLAAQFSLGPPPTEDAVALFRRVAACAEALRWQRDSATIFLDDVDQAGPDVQMQLLRLLALGGDYSRLTLVLSTTPTDAWRLGRELLDAADLHIDLDPSRVKQSLHQHALIEAGCDRPAFEPLSIIYVTEGVPRQVNRPPTALLGATVAER
jgi:hypothetical protein